MQQRNRGMVYGNETMTHGRRGNKANFFTRIPAWVSWAHYNCSSLTPTFHHWGRGNLNQISSEISSPSQLRQAEKSAECWRLSIFFFLKSRRKKQQHMKASKRWDPSPRCPRESHQDYLWLSSSSSPPASSAATVQEGVSAPLINSPGMGRWTKMRMRAQMATTTPRHIQLLLHPWKGEK